MLSVAIMAHPSRKKFVEELQPRLPLAEVVWDRSNDRWDTGRRSMMAYDPKCDWHLVVQDDAILCDSFLPGVGAALAGVPLEVPVSFYTGKTRPYGAAIAKAVKRATTSGAHWMSMRGPLWGVAIAVPTHMVAEMCAGADMMNIPNYDMRMAEWFHSKGIKCWYSLPSLVDHRTDGNPSLVPGRGHSPARTAFEFLADGDPLAIDWNTPAVQPMDPSERWTEDGMCTQCLQVFDSLPEAIHHSFEEHGLGKVDFLGSTAYHTEMLADLRSRLRDEVCGELYVLGGDLSSKVDIPHTRMLPRNVNNKMTRNNKPFTIVGAARDLKYIGNRSGWSIVGGAAN